MNTELTRLLGTEITNERISQPYPYVMLEKPSEPVALVLPSLPQGDLPVLCNFNNSVRKIASIRYSALAIRNLLKVSPLVFYKDAATSKRLVTSEDILEVLSKWMP